MSKLLVGMALACAACGGAAPGEPIANCPAQPAKTCTAVIAKAAELTHRRGKDVTFQIGVCEQEGWAGPVRDCLDAATTGDAVLACGKQYSLKGAVFLPSASVDQAIGEMAGFRDRMCACKDNACMKSVTAAMTAWAEAHRDEKAVHMTEPQQQKATTIADELAKCMMQVTP